jgi:polyphosphate kinase
MNKDVTSMCDPALFINRELSWLEFNQRVLEEALDDTNPLFERVKFFAIFSNNLDEFFEVRVAGLKQQIESGSKERGCDGMTAQETFRAVGRRVRQLVNRQYEFWRTELVPALAKNGIHFLDFPKLTAPDLEWLDQYYRANLHPVLTPLAIDPAHPFPQLLNKSLNFVVELEAPQDGGRPRLAVVQLPRNVARLVRLPRQRQVQNYLLLERLMRRYLNQLFAGIKLRGYWLFRLTRNSELYIDEEEVANFLAAVEQELPNRRRGDAVRLEVERGCPPEIRARLLENAHLSEDDLYIIDGPLSPTALMQAGEDNLMSELRDPPFMARVPTELREAVDVFAAIRKRDILLHHPYDSFDAVVEFMERAADDPRVLAIKQTLYRTGGDPRIIGALMKAVNNGKQVTAVVELKARFDEANNIEWARRLEDAGVHVVYGLVGLKIHAKLCLVVRHEEMGIQRYVHLSTGNYNPITSRYYTDLGLLTCHPDFGEDATNLFNLLTGISQFQGMRKLLVAPFELHQKLLTLIQRETDHARQGLPGRIVAKMNSLVDRQIIDSLYQASQAGVQVDLIVRGICCLRPQVKGVSRNITVRSIVDRFLEHSRFFYFGNSCQPEIYVGSADWMPRNFFGRIEVVFPIEDGLVRERLLQEVLAITLADNVKARVLQPGGSYRRLPPQPGEKPLRSQAEFINLKLLEADRRRFAGRRPRKGPFPNVKLAPRPRAL